MPEDMGLSSRDIIGRYFARLEAVTGSAWVDQVTMLFQSDKASEEYKFLGMTPAMQKWVGGREAKGLRDDGITIYNDEFEATLEIPAKWLRRDKTGQINVRIDDLVDRTVSHWASLVSGLIDLGPSAVCYDGQFFYDTDHKEGKSGVQSNDLTVDISAAPGAIHGTPTRPSAEEVSEMIMEAVQAMLGFKDDQGEPINESARAFQVMVPTTYFKPAAAALGNPIIGGGNTNTLTQLEGYTFGLAVNPRLSWADAISVTRTDGAMKPFIRQEEEEVQFAALAEGSEYAFDTKRHKYGVNASRGVGYGAWTGSVRVQAV